MRAILLAAGRGSRLGADRLPKPLWEIGPRSCRDSTPVSLLERQIHCLHHHGVDDVGVVVGWHAEEVMDAVRDLGVTFVANRHPDISKSGTSHSLQFAACSDWNPLDGKEPLLYLDGDLAYEQRVLEEIVSGPATTRLLVSPTTDEDSEEVRVYADGKGPRLLGKGLRSPLTDGLTGLGEATGIVRIEPRDHALVRSLLDWLVGRPGEEGPRGRGFGFAGIASEHEELAQYLMTLGRLGATVMSRDLLFMEIDFQREWQHLREDVYPRILERDREREKQAS